MGGIKSVTPTKNRYWKNISWNQGKAGCKNSWNNAQIMTIFFTWKRKPFFKGGCSLYYNENFVKSTILCIFHFHATQCWKVLYVNHTAWKKKHFMSIEKYFVKSSHSKAVKLFSKNVDFTQFLIINSDTKISKTPRCTVNHNHAKKFSVKLTF